MKATATTIILALVLLAFGCSESANRDRDPHTLLLYTEKQIIARVSLPEGASELITVPGSSGIQLGLFVEEHGELVDRNKSSSATRVVKLKQEGTRFFVSTYYAASYGFDLRAGNVFSVTNATGMEVNVAVYKD